MADSGGDPEEQLKSQLKTNMKEFMSSGESYGRSLFAASMVASGVGSIAWTAQRHRETMINLPQMVRWFRAIEELLAALGLYYLGFRRHETLADISFLIERAMRDVQAVVESALCGLRASAFDTLRDTMEIEYLLNDFFHEPSHVNKWRTAETRKEKDEFTPVNLRKREAQRQGVKVEDLQTNVDYRIHSQSLHVNSEYRHTAMRGVHEFDETLSLFPMYDLFFHGAGLLKTLMQYDEQLDEETRKLLGTLSLNTFVTVWDEVRQEMDCMRASAGF